MFGTKTDIEWFVDKDTYRDYFLGLLLLSIGDER